MTLSCSVDCGGGERRHHPFSQLWIQDDLLGEIADSLSKKMKVNIIAITILELYSQFLLALVCYKPFARVLGMTVDVDPELRYDRKPDIFWSYLKVVVLVVG